MIRPKVVVFDLGKVLLDFDYSVAAKSLSKNSDVSTTRINEFINQSPLLIHYEKGRISREEFFAEIQRMSGYRGTMTDFSTLFSDVFTPIEPMIQVQQRLAKAGVPTYIFSNTNDLAINHIRGAYPFFDTFDGYVLSYEHGFMKPEVELYLEVERMTGRTGSAICYLDDRQENVMAGQARGWTVCTHSDPIRSVDWLQHLELFGASCESS